MQILSTAAAFAAAAPNEALNRLPRPLKGLDGEPPAPVLLYVLAAASLLAVGYVLWRLFSQRRKPPAGPRGFADLRREMEQLASAETPLARHAGELARLVKEAAEMAGLGRASAQTGEELRSRLEHWSVSPELGRSLGAFFVQTELMAFSGAALDAETLAATTHEAQRLVRELEATLKPEPQKRAKTKTLALGGGAG